MKDKPYCPTCRMSIVMFGLILLHAFFLISPIMYLVGLRALVVVPTTILFLCLIMALGSRRTSLSILLLVSLSFVTACVTGAYWESWRIALFPSYFCVSLLTLSITNEKERRSVVATASILLGIILIGAWISFLAALGGASPVGQFTAATGRLITVYQTTLTSFAVGSFIRPAGIYDEPGALSMVVCVFAFLRHAMGMDRRLTWGLIAMGFVTFSLAHLIYATIHFLSERRVVIAWTNLLVVMAACFAVLSSIGVWDYFDTRLLARVSVTSQTGRVVSGDNRTAKMMNAYEAIRDGGGRVFAFGIDSACMEGTSACEAEHPLMGQNPLSPLAQYGILVSWPYYVFLATAICVGTMRRAWWPLFAVGLLFIQRPSVLSAGYSMLAALALFSVARDQVFRSGATMKFSDRLGGGLSMFHLWRPAGTMGTLNTTAQ